MLPLGTDEELVRAANARHLYKKGLQSLSPRRLALYVEFEHDLVLHHGSMADHVENALFFRSGENFSEWLENAPFGKFWSFYMAALEQTCTQLLESRVKYGWAQL